MMLISDWSSDVCSSYLIRISSVRRDGGTAVHGEHRELSAFGLGLDWRSERVRLSADIGWQDHKLSRSQASINVAQGLRSEEHTSELQSLMRISYAVFCLKKKKQN